MGDERSKCTATGTVSTTTFLEVAALMKASGGEGMAHSSWHAELMHQVILTWHATSCVWPDVSLPVTSTTSFPALPSPAA